MWKGRKGRHCIALVFLVLGAQYCTSSKSEKMMIAKSSGNGCIKMKAGGGYVRRYADSTGKVRTESVRMGHRAVERMSF